MKLPQLSLRDLFWLVALVAMACGWWVDRSRATAMQQEAELWFDRAATLRRELLYRGTDIRFDDDGGMTAVTGSWTDGS